MKKAQTATLTLENIVGGGQTIGTLADGRKAFVWGGLPGEQVTIRVTKKKSKLVEGVVTEVHHASPERITPVDPDSYLSTSPWQIMNFSAEQQYKAQLIAEAFRLHHVTLSTTPPTVYTDEQQLAYRNKVEYSWYSDTDPDSETDTLDLAFFRRGSKGKIIVDGTSLARPEINTLAVEIRDLLRTKPVTARNLKTLLIRCSRSGKCIWQLYLKDHLEDVITAEEAANLSAQGGEIIYSNPKSPASVITERLAAFGDTVLTDEILGVPFRYVAEGFFQVNLPVYEQALTDMAAWIRTASVESNNALSTVDMYSGVGTIGLTIGGEHVTLVEINEHAVQEMQRNIHALGRENNAKAVLAASEQALDYINPDNLIVVDPPRAGLHADVVDRLLEQLPPRIVYLSCNPVTQARDVALLSENYHIVHHQGYNFFPRTPHIENLVVLDKMPH
jgi:uncharacterized RNA methyltransferase EF_0728